MKYNNLQNTASIFPIKDIDPGAVNIITCPPETTANALAYLDNIADCHPLYLHKESGHFYPIYDGDGWVKIAPYHLTVLSKNNKTPLVLMYYTLIYIHGQGGSIQDYEIHEVSIQLTDGLEQIIYTLDETYFGVTLRDPLASHFNTHNQLEVHGIRGTTFARTIA